MLSTDVNELINTLSDCLENSDSVHTHVPNEIIEQTLHCLAENNKYTLLTEVWVENFGKMSWEQAITILEITKGISPEEAKRLKELK